MSKDKDKISKIFKKRRGKITEQEIRSSSKKVWERFLALEEMAKCRHIMMYMPIRGEIDFTPYFHEIYSKGIEISVPVLNTEEKEMNPALWKPNEKMIEGPMDILVPEHPKFIDEHKIEIVVIPGVAFDQKGARIGFGEGYYDRFLKSLHALRVGVAYDFQILKDIPVHELDVPVDYVLTESKTYHFPANFHQWRFYGAHI